MSYKYDPITDAEYDDFLPAKEPIKEAVKKERTFRTGVATDVYMLLEKESIQRGIKPYGLCQKVMTLYAKRRLVYVADLPATLQQSIAEHYARSNEPLIV